MKREINEAARELSVSLEKLGKKSGKGLWLDLAYRVCRPVRRKAQVNLYRLSAAAKKNAGKTLVVPGKVLATGDAPEKTEVACLSCSGSAREKIAKAGGKVISIKELASEKIEPGKVVIVE